MRNVAAVIGANYGDEGKGHIVDYLATPGSLVVRFNGGAQAGHTVVTPDGCRHVFHHFGSGTLAHARTFLSRFFLVNPALFVTERRQLELLGFFAGVYVDGDALVTTPYDMLLNQQAEIARGAERHGSCGVGVNETVVRSETTPLYVKDLFAPPERWQKKLLMIGHDYLPARAEKLGINPKLLQPDQYLERFVEDVETFKNSILVRGWDSVWRQAWPNIIFEGAQGLCLDQDSPDFPHVTRSKTGIHNVEILRQEAKLDDILHIYYVTRAYLTRHGRGPLPNEEWQLPYAGVKDATNVFNQHQENLRFAPLDIKALQRRVVSDLFQSRHFAPHLAVTCLDQVGRHVHWREGSAFRAGPVRDFLSALWNAGQTVISTGPTREDVKSL